MRATGVRRGEDLLDAGSHNTTAEDDAGGSTHDPLARHRAPVSPRRNVLRGIISRHQSNANQYKPAGPLASRDPWHHSAQRPDYSGNLKKSAGPIGPAASRMAGGCHVVGPA